MTSKLKPRMRCPACEYPLDDWGECSSCRVRKQAKLPNRARCETCKRFGVWRCAHMGPHAVCVEWSAG